eukprot:TRINITY_DN4361_c0_g1_i1.p1 TRINITY_DN4361_c0_g1~~TRINITY_DN4361_c0_g1_i1.p1  ORF type:complete len:340 (-),score=79.32 TRINITY_DN4361_c0_g1_i1:359-1378(-)
MSGKRESLEVVSAGGPAKKAKEDYSQIRCVELQKAIKSTQEREDVREALAVITPFCLGVTKDCRHKFQDEAVEMVGSIIQQEKRYLEYRVVETAALTESPTQGMQAQGMAVKTAEREWATARDVAHERKLALATEARAYLAAKAAFVDAEAARDAGHTECRLADTNKEVLQALVDQMDSLFTIPHKIPEYIETLALHVELEDAMNKSVALALAVNPATRGPFDMLVLRQLMDKLKGRVEALQQLIDNSELTMMDRAAAVQTANAMLTQARERQTSSANAFKEAREKMFMLEIAVMDAQKELRFFAKKASDAAAVAADARNTLDVFSSGPLVAYAELRDR